MTMLTERHWTATADAERSTSTRHDGYSTFITRALGLTQVESTLKLGIPKIWQDIHGFDPQHRELQISAGNRHGHDYLYVDQTPDEEVVTLTLDSLLDTRDQTDDLIDWIAAHPEILAPYPGEWVAFSGRHVVAHAASFWEATNAARALGIEPFLVPVAQSDSIRV